jgi:site-specific recombinase XerD
VTHLSALTKDEAQDRGQHDWLGHQAIQHTTRYTELSQERFKDFWQP